MNADTLSGVVWFVASLTGCLLVMVVPKLLVGLLLGLRGRRSLEAICLASVIAFLVAIASLVGIALLLGMALDVSLWLPVVAVLGAGAISVVAEWRLVLWSLGGAPGKMLLKTIAMDVAALPLVIASVALLTLNPFVPPFSATDSPGQIWTLVLVGVLTIAVAIAALFGLSRLARERAAGAAASETVPEEASPSPRRPAAVRAIAVMLGVLLLCSCSGLVVMWGYGGLGGQRVTVLEADPQVVGDRGTLLVKLRIANGEGWWTADTEQYVGMDETYVLVDTKGRTVASESAVYRDETREWVGPGGSETVTVLFEVPKDANELTLRYSSHYSGGRLEADLPFVDWSQSKE